MRDITITDLLPESTLKSLQDAFCNLTGMAAQVTDASGLPVTQPSNPEWRSAFGPVTSICQ